MKAKAKAPKPEAPAHLSAAARQLWGDVLDGPASAGRLVLLTVALECFDRYQRQREVNAKIASRDGQLMELRLRGQFGRLWKLLALQWHGQLDSRMRGRH